MFGEPIYKKLLLLVPIRTSLRTGSSPNLNVEGLMGINREDQWPRALRWWGTSRGSVSRWGSTYSDYPWCPADSSAWRWCLLLECERSLKRTMAPSLSLSMEPVLKPFDSIWYWTIGSMNWNTQSCSDCVNSIIGLVIFFVQVNLLFNFVHQIFFFLFCTALKLTQRST